METDEQLAKKRVQDRTGFIVHVAMYAVMNTGCFLIWYLTAASYPWFIWPMLGWGIAIVAHAITLAIGPGSSFEQRAIDKELRRVRIAPR